MWASPAPSHHWLRWGCIPGRYRSAQPCGLDLAHFAAAEIFKQASLEEDQLIGSAVHQCVP